MGEAIYKQNPQGAGPQPDPSGAEPSADNTKDEKVVDASTTFSSFVLSADGSAPDGSG